jgi:DNA-binding GntR family transcriptional regulator
MTGALPEWGARGPAWRLLSESCYCIFTTKKHLGNRFLSLPSRHGDRTGQEDPDLADRTTRLHKMLASQILFHARQKGLKKGDRLKEEDLAAQFGVSRSPIRAALGLLATNGVVVTGAGPGHVLAQDSARVDPDCFPEPQDDVAMICNAVIDGYFAGTLSGRVTESEILRRTGTSRALVAEAMTRLAAEGILTRADGYGWRLRDILRSRAANTDSFRLRIILEPAAILEPGFVLDRPRLIDARDRHLAFLDAPDRPIDSRHLYDLNGSFHDTVVNCSNNPFLIDAVNRLHHLRKLLEYRAYSKRDRVIQACHEHVAVMDALLRDARDEAADLLRAHLRAGLEADAAFGAGAGPDHLLREG